MNHDSHSSNSSMISDFFLRHSEHALMIVGVFIIGAILLYVDKKRKK